LFRAKDLKPYLIKVKGVDFRRVVKGLAEVASTTADVLHDSLEQRPAFCYCLKILPTPQASTEKELHEANFIA
jgi:hypothetical protein